MTFGHEKRRLLGALALLAPIPLPLNDVLEWPLLFLYLLVVGLFLYRLRSEPERWLPTWALNVLGLIYLPLFFVDLAVLGRHQLVRPVIHLALFTVVVKLFSLTRERDKWQTLIAIFFLFVAAMATSVHPTILIYLVVFVLMSLALLLRFAVLHVLTGFGGEGQAPPAGLPVRGFLGASTMTALILAAPLFVLLPRVRSPYIVGSGTGTGTVVHASGFTDEVTLDAIGKIRSSREVVLRLVFDDAQPPLSEMRFKAATFEHYDGRVWRRSPPQNWALRPGRGGVFRLAPGETKRRARIWLRPLNSSSLVIPVNSLAVSMQVPALVVDRGGALAVGITPLETLEYSVALAEEPAMTALVPEPSASEPALDLGGLTPQISNLAHTVMGSGEVGEQVRRLERYFTDNFDYTVDYVERTGETSLEDFLFRYQSGHCEYFASAMVLMLRSQGIPARLVTGFLGAEYNPLEGYYIVRQLNAHAWVEAYTPGAGWQIFDPTPPAGRPDQVRHSFMGFMQQAYDYFLFRWDRYVLTYGFYDQAQFLFQARHLWLKLRRWLGSQPVPAADSSSRLEEQEAAAGAEAQGQTSGLHWHWFLPLLLVLVAILLWYRYQSTPLDATAAYRRLRRILSRSGLEVGGSMAPLRLRRQADRRFPQAAVHTDRVVDLYLLESFGGRRLDELERQSLELALEEVARSLAKAG